MLKKSSGMQEILFLNRISPQKINKPKIPFYFTVRTSGHFDIRKLYLISFEECVFFCKKKVATKYYNHLVISSVNAMKPATKGHMSDNLW